MNDQLLTRNFLHIFDVVSSNGKKERDVFELLGIKAWHDFDGYTCWLAYKDLTVTLLFHGKLSVECKHEETLSEFKQKYEDLMKIYVM